MKSSTGFERWDVVAVPFPSEEGEARPRPSLVVSQGAFNRANGFTILAMITRPVEDSWPSDLPIEHWAAAGLPAEALVRCKLFTLPNEMLRRLGRLARSDRERCAGLFRRVFVSG